MDFIYIAMWRPNLTNVNNRTKTFIRYENQFISSAGTVVAGADISSVVCTITSSSSAILRSRPQRVDFVDHSRAITMRLSIAASRIHAPLSFGGYCARLHRCFQRQYTRHQQPTSLFDVSTRSKTNRPR